MAIFSILALKNRITERFNANRARIISGIDLQEILHDLIDSLLGVGGQVDPGTLNPEIRFSDYGLDHAPNGIRTDFSPSHEFILLSTHVYLNGVRQFLGNDYSEKDGNVISFTTPPFTGDSIIVDYYYLST